VSGDEAIVDRQLVGKITSFRDADRIDLADKVGDGYVRRR